MKPTTARKIHFAIKYTGVSLVWPKTYKELGLTISAIEDSEKKLSERDEKRRK